MPYDTIRGVIFGEGNGSLKDFGISFEKEDGEEEKNANKFVYYNIYMYLCNVETNNNNTFSHITLRC